MSRTLQDIREEHYSLMVSQMVGWMQLHGDPKVLIAAVTDAAKLEQERLQALKRQRQAGD